MSKYNVLGRRTNKKAVPVDLFSYNNKMHGALERQYLNKGQSCNFHRVNGYHRSKISKRAGFLANFASAFPVQGTSPTLSSGSQVCSPFSSSRSATCVNSATSDVDQNALLVQDSLPLFESIKSEQVVPAITTLLSEFKKNFASLEEKWSTGANSYTETIEEMEKEKSKLSYAWGVVSHLNGVKNSDELRTARSAVQPEVVSTFTEVGQSRALYDALSTLKNTAEEWDKLDAGQKRLVNLELQDMTLSGVGLDGEKQTRFKEIKQNLSELSTKFNNNVLDSTKAFVLEITDANELEGAPQTALDLWAQTAKGRGLPDGRYLITLDMPSYLPVMQHVKSGKIREKCYRAFISRASAADTSNESIIREILILKEEMAKMLGFNNYAELSLSRKMAPSKDAVDELTTLLREKAFPKAKEDLEEIKAFAKSKGYDGELKIWDTSYWSERYKEEKYSIKEEELRPYFALPNVLEGMFALANRIFGIDIIEAPKGSVNIWHPDVMFFNVYDSETKEEIAGFYLDPYSRPADKRGGAWMDVCLGKSKVLDRKPVAYLTCNGSPPLADAPSLMTFREVETLFHEFGHGLQHMLTKVPHGDIAGINGVEWDAVELPSQFMENWCYDRKCLYSFAKHYKTGEPLPEEDYKKLIALRNFMAGSVMLRQLYFGKMDMEIHSSYDPKDMTKSVFDIQHELAAEYTVMPPLAEDRFLCSFSHIFGGGYAAGYYSYKWAEVMSADAFEAFEEEGLENEEKVQEVGRRFRNTVLAMGGSAHPTEVYEMFRGRQPKPDALLKHSGF